MATYNGEKYIREQLESILVQLSKNDEIIISDDSSSDRTVSIVNSIGDERIKIIRHSSNSRKNDFSNRNKAICASKNFEHALLHARGHKIFISDQDDIWLPNKVKIMSEALDKYDLIVSDCSLVDSNKNIIENSFFDSNKTKLGFFYSLYRNPFLGCCLAFNRQILDVSIPFPKYIPMYDIWIGMVSETFFNTALIKKSLILHRRHGENASSVNEKSPYSIREKIFFRAYIIYHLTLIGLKKMFSKRFYVVRY